MDTNKKNVSGGKESVSHKLGDKIERVGQKLKEKGATKLGDSIYRLGNKIEHSGDK